MEQAQERDPLRIWPGSSSSATGGRPYLQESYNSHPSEHPRVPSRV
jgi:hypothetical protein